MEVYTAKEAANYLRVSAIHLKILLRSGEIKGFRLSHKGKKGHWRVSKKEILKFIEKKENL